MKRLFVLTSLLFSLPALAATDPNCPVVKAPIVVTLNWTAPTQQASSPPSALAPIQLPLTYNVYMTTTKGGEAGTTPILTGISALTTGVTATFQGNTSYYFTLAAVDALNQVGLSTNEVCFTSPPFPPSTFTVTITAT